MKLFYSRTGAKGVSPLILKRIIFDIALFFAIFYLPWWVIVIAGFWGAFTFSFYYEIIVAGLLLDILYGARLLALEGIYNTIFAVGIFLVASYSKKAVR